MRCSVSAVALVASLAAACGDTAMVITIAGDLAGDGLDTMCLAVHDRAAGGGEFARTYRFDELGGGELTLTVEAGQAAAGVASVRGYRAGLERARDRRPFEFDGLGELTLYLRACPAVTAGAPTIADRVAAPAGARAAVSFGRGGSQIVAVAPGAASVFVANDGGLSDAGVALPEPPASIAALIAFDVDGDCDDDLLLVGAPGLALWRRDGRDYTAIAAPFSGVGNADAATVAAVADVDSDGDLDVVAGAASGASLVLYRNDGTGELTADGAALPGGLATDPSALAFGELDGDGHVDLVVGQGASAPGFPRVMLNDAQGEGNFVAAPAALPEIALAVRDVAVADANGDGFDDVFFAVSGGAMRAFVNRGDARLEDRSYVVLPDRPGDVASIAVAEWDGDCLVDVVLGFAGGDAVGWRGSDTGVFGSDPLPGASGAAVELADVDDDGDRDLLLVGSELVWVRR